MCSARVIWFCCNTNQLGLYASGRLSDQREKEYERTCKTVLEIKPVCVWAGGEVSEVVKGERGREKWIQSGVNE